MRQLPIALMLIAGLVLITVAAQNPNPISFKSRWQTLGYDTKIA